MTLQNPGYRTTKDMSLDKAIESGKEWRKPYRGARAWTSGCRPHGNCGHCYGSRMHQRRRNEPADLDEQIYNADQWFLFFWGDDDGDY